MGLHERAQEVLVGTYHYCDVAIGRATGIVAGICCCTLYLHTFLKSVFNREWFRLKQRAHKQEYRMLHILWPADLAMLFVSCWVLSQQALQQDG